MVLIRRGDPHEEQPGTEDRGPRQWRAVARGRARTGGPPARTRRAPPGSEPRSGLRGAAKLFSVTLFAGTRPQLLFRPPVHGFPIHLFSAVLPVAEVAADGGQEPVGFPDLCRVVRVAGGRMASRGGAGGAHHRPFPLQEMAGGAVDSAVAGEAPGSRLEGSVGRPGGFQVQGKQHAAPREEKHRYRSQDPLPALQDLFPIHPTRLRTGRQRVTGAGCLPGAIPGQR